VNSYDIGDQVQLDGYVVTSPTVGTIQAGTVLLEVADAAAYGGGNPILVEGAGAVGADHVTTVASVSGNTVTLTDPADTSVVHAVVGKPTNATVTLTVRLPDGTTAAPTPANLATGRYRGIYSPTLAGEHWWRLNATGTAVTAGERAFQVRARRVP